MSWVRNVQFSIAQRGTTMKTILKVSIIAFALSLASQAIAQDAPAGNPPGILEITLFDFDGDEATLRERFKGAQMIQAKINPEARLTLLVDLAHGPAINRYRIHAYYPDFAYYARAQFNERNSEEWQALLERRREGSAKRTYRGISRIVASGRPTEAE